MIVGKIKGLEGFDGVETVGVAEMQYRLRLIGIAAGHRRTHHRPVGQRDTQPGVVRLPGGCICAGYRGESNDVGRAVVGNTRDDRLRNDRGRAGRRYPRWCQLEVTKISG